MNNLRTGVLLINLGTPDSPSVGDVRKYLREFLMDPRVMDIPYVQRFLLINCIIAPLRAPQSAKIYKDLWTSEGSPLKFHGEKLRHSLQKELGEAWRVVFAMRYQNPSIKSVLDKLKDKGLDEIIVIPLYPQYAESSTGSTIEKVLSEIQQWRNIPRLRVISQFPNHPLLIKAFTEIGHEYMARQDYDHYVFTYHGLPERQILKASVQNCCQLNDQCCSVYHPKNKYCYRAQCFETTRQLALSLGISSGNYTVCFQSRLGKTPWIKPYTDEMIPRLIARGIKRVLVFAPSFVADCLETTIEIGVEYKKMFEDHGGQKWDLVESLNTHPLWIQCLKELISENSFSNSLVY